MQQIPTAETKPLKSKVVPSTPEFQQNFSEMLALCDDLNNKLTECLEQGRDKDVLRHYKRGQLLARERIELLLDRDTPFLELMPLAGYGQDGIPPGASVIAGIGIVWYY